MILPKVFSTMARKLKPIHIIPNTGKKHTGTIFFFHGSGSTAEALRYGVAATVGKDFTFSHLKVVFPTAPLQPYTPLDGELSNVWFDRLAISPSVPEVSGSLAEIAKDIKELIQEENKQGIPNERIIVGGFSMGGALALHTGFRWFPDLAGVFALSSFLNKGSAVYSFLKDTSPSKTPELLQYHGAKDDLVPIMSGKETFDNLKMLGIKGEFKIENYADHSVTRDELLNVHSWILKCLPDE